MERHEKFGIGFCALAVLMLAFPVSMPLSPVNADLGNTTSYGTYEIYLSYEPTVESTDTLDSSDRNVFKYENLSDKDKAIVREVIETGKYERSYSHGDESPYPDELPVGGHDNPSFFVVEYNGTYYELTGHFTFGSSTVNVPMAKDRLGLTLRVFGLVVAVVGGIYFSGIGAPHSWLSVTVLGAIAGGSWLLVYFMPFRFITAIMLVVGLLAEVLGVTVLGLVTLWKAHRSQSDPESVATTSTEDSVDSEE